jgi:hypothetical protein
MASALRPDASQSRPRYAGACSASGQDEDLPHVTEATAIQLVLYTHDRELFCSSFSSSMCFLPGLQIGGGYTIVPAPDRNSEKPVRKDPGK